MQVPQPTQISRTLIPIGPNVWRVYWNAGGATIASCDLVLAESRAATVVGQDMAAAMQEIIKRSPAGPGIVGAPAEALNQLPKPGRILNGN